MAEFYSTYVVNCVINALSSCTAIMLNILAIHAMRKTLSLPKPLKALLLSLAVSDLAVGLVAFWLTTASEILTSLFKDSSVIWKIFEREATKDQF